ncbi:MAG: hypothetical protein QW719_02755, partial [Candidatus Micrarchaeaceae archaeon]
MARQVGYLLLLLLAANLMSVVVASSSLPRPTCPYNTCMTSSTYLRCTCPPNYPNLVQDSCPTGELKCAAIASTTTTSTSTTSTTTVTASGTTTSQSAPSVQLLSSQLCGIINGINTIVGTIALVMFLIGGVLYAIAHFLPTAGQVKGSLQGWAMGMIIGG